MHVDNVAPQLPPFHVDIQSDNEEFVQRHRVLVPSPSASASIAMTPIMPSELSLDVAIQNCMRGWPDYRTLYGHTDDPAFLKDAAFDGMPYSDVMHDIFTPGGTDPVLQALRAAGATEVPLDDFRMCNSHLDMELPLSGSGYQAWRLRQRRVCVARVRDWQVALRVGNPPGGALANSL